MPFGHLMGGILTIFLDIFSARLGSPREHCNIVNFYTYIYPGFINSGSNCLSYLSGLPRGFKPGGISPSSWHFRHRLGIFAIGLAFRHLAFHISPSAWHPYFRHRLGIPIFAISLAFLF